MKGTLTLQHLEVGAPLPTLDELDRHLDHESLRQHGSTVAAFTVRYAVWSGRGLPWNLRAKLWRHVPALIQKAHLSAVRDVQEMLDHLLWDPFSAGGFPPAVPETQGDTHV